MPNNKLQSQGQQLLEVLTGLAGRATGGRNLAEVAQESPLLKGLELIGQLVAKGGAKAGEMSVISPQEQVTSSLQGTQTEQAIQAGEQADPLMKATMDEGIKIRKEEVREAKAGGMSVEQILAMAQQGLHTPGNSPTGGNAALSNAMQSVQPQPGQTPAGIQGVVPGTAPEQNTGPMSALKGLLQQVSENALTSLGVSPTDIALKKQKLAGEEPLQAGEIEKMAIQSSNKIAEELAKGGGISALTPESATKFANLVTGSKATESMAKILENNPKALIGSAAPVFMKSQAGRQLATQMSVAFGNQLRAVSGAAISQDEIRKQIKTYKASLFDSPESVRQKLTTLNTFYKTALETADPSGTHRERAGGGAKNTKLIEQAKAELARRRGNK